MSTESAEALDADYDEQAEKGGKTPLLLSWIRSQFVSVTATGVDFLVTIFLTEVVKTWYVAATMSGAIAGGVVSFILCRAWAFNRRNQIWKYQMLRYAMAISLSMTLNTLAVWFMTENFHIPYIYAKIMAAALVGLTVNFLVFRYFVFK